ncbi:MAG: AAA family ATPase [Sedimentisphaerales bacterium]|nr:AAA family ATPase [Sedimentisphaerales bacterium]
MGENIDQTKAIRLLEYLEQLNGLRSKVVYDINNYDNVLWFSDVPFKKSCFTQAWGLSEEMPEVWLYIRKEPEPPVPDVPEECEDWIKKETLYQSEELPQLYSTISQTIEEKIGDELIPKTIHLNLDDFPNVQSKWDKYLEKEWLSWMDQHSSWSKIHNIYTKLFEIHQQQEKLGEEYELVIGLGLLQWKVPNGQNVKRHLITARASLMFNHESGRFTLTADEEGAKLDVEVNMLDEYQPVSSLTSLKSSLIAAEENPWDRIVIDSVLSSLANVIGEGNGEYKPTINFESIIDSKPRIHFAPALILRKRSIKGLEMTLQRIKESIQAGSKLPEWFEDLCERNSVIEDRRGDQSGDYLQEDTTVYFPLLSNEQQRQIVEKYQRANGVLVQGPPGTGKSLTIANLICHLLATGKRVLVTAKTPRALQVLHGLLPKEIKPLCVSLLGRGQEEQKSLQNSVTSILSKHGEWQPLVSESIISDLEGKLYKNRSIKVEIEAQIRKLREKDSIKHTILYGAYQGSSAQIATKVKQQETLYGWFIDKAIFDITLPIQKNDLINLRQELIFFNAEKLRELDQTYIPPSELYPLDYVRELIADESVLKEKYDKAKEKSDNQIEELLSSANLQDVENLLNEVASLDAEIKSVLNRPYEWIRTAVSEILADRDTPWRSLELVTQQKLTGLKEKAQVVDSQCLELKKDVQETQLIFDAEKLKYHLEKGGSLGFSIFRPKIVHELYYVISEVIIDGRKCCTIDALTKLIDHLRTKAEIQYLWNLWKGRIDQVQDVLFLQVAHLEEALEALSSAVALYKKMDSSRNIIKEIEGLQEPAWHSPQDVSKLIISCKAVIYGRKLSDIRAKISEFVFMLDSFVKNPLAHQVISELLLAINNRDSVQYANSIEKVMELEQMHHRWKWVEVMKERVETHFPTLSEELQTDPENETWESRFRIFEDAYKWAQAKDWINNYLSEDNLLSLCKNLELYESQDFSFLAQLASEKAWRFCFNRMTDEQSRYLRMFSRVRIPKTGKNVLRRRKEAQEYLNKCRDAVPAWIMPLYRVYDTVSPSQNIFDVIIVDEASQCGQEALPLFFLGKKIFIVGDNKQISPMTPGVKEDLIHKLIERYLHDFNYKGTFEPTKSLFEQAFFRFPNRNHIRLREHFRCMPEIIRFSNELCYEDQPLIPLKQFSSQRLEPLKRVYVPNGYREGSLSFVINRPEAESLVNTIIECCVDDRYQDKTMGVIVLQGHRQDKLIESMLIQELDSQEIENRRLLCGDPYTFQGDERDIIFLSMIAAPNERIGVLTNEKEDYVRRFNVSASRAKEQMWLFHSVELHDLSTSCLRHQLLSFFLGFPNVTSDAFSYDIDKLRHEAFTANRASTTAPQPFESWFELDVFLELVNREYKVTPQYPFAGKRIDLVVEGQKGELLAVECYGDYWHGIADFEKDMARQRQMERCGWVFHIIRECDFRGNTSQCMQSLIDRLESRGIFPISNFQDTSYSIEEAVVKPSINSEQKVLVASNSLMCDLYPSSIEEALSLKSNDLQSAILKILSKRPNQSCIKDKVHAFVLKEWGLITRGTPRSKFARKVAQCLRQLEKSNKVETYKSKNIRIRLI